MSAKKMTVGKAVVCESELGQVDAVITSVDRTDGIAVMIEIGKQNHILDRCMFSKMVFGFDGTDFSCVSPDRSVTGNKLIPVTWTITRI